MPSGPHDMRELFIYWKTAATTADAAENEARNWQAELRRAYPSLSASLYRRADDSSSGSPTTATLMETYAGAAIDSALELRLAEEGHARLGRWMQGPRIVEVFVRCPST
jgi:Domain of unknown function (DUF4936)